MIIAMEHKKDYKTNADCIFCKITLGTIPSKKVYEDESILGFYDLNPKAKVHLLLIPKKHYENAVELAENDENAFVRIPKIAKKLAEELSNGDFRLVYNNGKSAGQVVFHTHAHILCFE
jgi:histidine triad (HIT) family protein